jgi:hypothetical protein
MTAPARPRRKAPAQAPPREGTQTREATRVERRHTRNGQQRTTAAERAYARRAQRADVSRRTEAEPGPSRGFRLRWPKSRASFVLIVMTLLAAGVATTLLLSTQAIADSYRLEQIREENASLIEQSQQLQQDVSTADSASSLAARAKALGMVPAGDPAHLVQNADGSVTVVGEPKKAVTQAPPPPPSTPPPPPSTPAAPSASTQAGAPPSTSPRATPPAEGDVAQGGPQQPRVGPPPAGGR